MKRRQVKLERFVPFDAELTPGRLSPAIEYYTAPDAAVRACSSELVQAHEALLAALCARGLAVPGLCVRDTVKP